MFFSLSGNRQFYQNRNHMPQNNRFQAGAPPSGPPMAAGNYHHRNMYNQQPNTNANAVNATNGTYVDGGNAHITSDAASPNAAIELYNATNANDDLQQQTTASQPQTPAQTYNSTAQYPAAPSPGLYSAGQYMVDAGVQNIIGEFQNSRI